MKFLFPLFIFLLFSCGKQNSIDTPIAVAITPQDIQTLSIKNENEIYSVTGKTISIDEYDLQGLREKFHNKEGIKKVTFNCEELILLTRLNIPGADLTLKVKKLTAYKGAQINLTPTLKIPQANPFEDGRDGLPGSTLILEVQSASIPNELDRPLFVLKGGNGQNAGIGRDGDEGESVHHSNGVIGSLTFNRRTGEVYPTGGHIKRPTEGKEAIPPGKPGEPGKGGTLRTNIVLNPNTYNIEGGRAGLQAPVVYSGEPGSPNPYIIVNEKNIRETFYLTTQKAEAGPKVLREIGAYGELVYTKN